MGIAIVAGMCAALVLLGVVEICGKDLRNYFHARSANKIVDVKAQAQAAKPGAIEKIVTGIMSGEYETRLIDEDPTDNTL